MEKEILTIKSWESIEIEVEGKTIEIQSEEQKSMPTPSEHTMSAIGWFLQKMETIMPELKWEKGEKGDKGDKWDKWDKGDTGGKGDKWDKWDSIKWDKGDKWDKWDDWKSAYELAVEKWYTWTLEEWLASLKAKDGKDWKDGRDGRPWDQWPRGTW
jgi:hypothetical protein